MCVYKREHTMEDEQLADAKHKAADRGLNPQHQITHQKKQYCHCAVQNRSIPNYKPEFREQAQNNDKRESSRKRENGRCADQAAVVHTENTFIVFHQTIHAHQECRIIQQRAHKRGQVNERQNHRNTLYRIRQPIPNQFSSFHFYVPISFSS